MKNAAITLKYLFFVGALVIGLGSLASRTFAASTYVITTGALADSTAGANQRKMARTSDGVYHVVYHKLNTDGYYQIYCADSADGGQTWVETPLISGPLVSSISHDNRPSIVADSQDNLYVVWWGKSVDSPTYNQIRFLKYSHAAHAWGSIQTLTSGNFDQTSSSMTVDSHDNVYVAWNGESATSPSFLQIHFIEYSAATDSWGAISDLTSESYDQQRPFITADYEDQIHLTWYGEDASSTGYTQIRYRKLSSGVWSPAIDLTSGNYNQDFTSLAVDSHDNVHVAFHGTLAASPTVAQIRYIEYVKATDTWSGITTFSTEQYSRGQYNPYLSVDSADGVHIVWNGRVDGVSTDYVIRYVENLGSGWTAPQTLSTDTSVDNQYPNLIWYVNPVVRGARINRPKTGYAFIWSSGTTVYFYASDDLAWETPAARHTSGSGGVFVPPPASVSVVRPSAGRQLKPGTVTAIDWISANAAFARFRVSYSADGGLTWSELASADGTIDSYSWTVPNGPISNGLVRVEGLGADGAVVATAQSGAFSISGAETGAPSAGTSANPPYTASNAQAAAPDINTDKGLVMPTTNNQQPITPPCVSGALIKASLPSVYYCGADGKRYAFLNDKAFFTWYKDFSSVKIISDAELAEIPFGGNITYRPGVKMVKVPSDPKVYAVAQGGVLRWISSEAVAVRLYGADWNKEIDDIPDSFFADYKVGEPL
jgi:hypothetical protein